MFSNATLTALAVATVGALIAGILVVHYMRGLDRAGPGDVGFWLGAAIGAVAAGLGSDWLVQKPQSCEPALPWPPKRGGSMSAGGDGK